MKTTLGMLGLTFPSNIRDVTKILRVDNRIPIKVLCPKCWVVYEEDECVVPADRIHGESKARVCTHVTFPNHSHQKQLQPCGQLLVAKVQTAAVSIVDDAEQRRRDIRNEQRRLTHYIGEGRIKFVALSAQRFVYPGQ
jgi:hypothetical protein